MEYAATVTINPLTALRMLEDFGNLNPGMSLVLKNCNFFYMCFPD